MQSVGQTSQIATAAPMPDGGGVTETGQTGLLLTAFEMFTQASSSLESAFQQLQARALHLSEELESRNRQLRRSIREKAEVQSYLKKILETLPCGVIVQDNSGRITLCNSVASEILQGAAPRRRRKRGFRGCAAQVLETIAAATTEGPPTEIEIPYEADGATRVLATSGTRLKDRSSRPMGTVHIIRDVTELKALQDHGKRNERLAAMGEMAVELAHEIRNPLGSIELFASLLEKELPDRSDTARWAENIRVGSRSLNNIVSNMLHFARPITPVMREVDLSGLASEVLDFTEPITRQRGVTVEKSLAASRSAVCGDRDLLKQMMLNLILNSLQAMPSKGTIGVSTRNPHPAAGAAGAARVELVIRDSGLGIAADNLKRIFDPFFTTSKRGTGLGLSVVHRIVERHSGAISVESRLGEGTTFTVSLPAAAAGELTQDRRSGRCVTKSWS